MMRDRIKHLVLEAHRRSLWQVLGVYVLSSWLVLQVVDTLTGVLGLPAWVPPLGLILLLIGLPIVLATAVVQEGGPTRRRDAREPGDASLPGSSGADEPSSPIPDPSPTPTFLQRHLTWRRSLSGGVAAFGLLALVVAAYFGGWALGLGPMGSLLAAGELEEGDLIVLADFQGPTDDPELGEVVTDALRIDLLEHPLIRVLDRSEIGPVLERMEVDPHAPLDPAAAREVALREGLGAFIEGQVSGVGTGYVLSATLRTADDDRALAGFRESAAGPDDLIPAIERLSARIRERAGESLPSIRAGPGFERVTTESLDALRLYSEANRAELQGDPERAVRLFEEALEIDPEFGMAWRRLGMVRLQVRPRHEVNEALEQAYRLRDRLSLRERYHVESVYYHQVEWDLDRAAEAYDRLLDLDPHDQTALNNLGLLAAATRQYDRTVELLERAAQGPGASPLIHRNLIEQHVLAEDTRAARDHLTRFRQAYPAHPLIAEAEAAVLFMEGDLEGARSVLEAHLASEGLSAADRRRVLNVLSQMALWEGRVAEARERYAESRALAGETGGAAARWFELLLAARGEALVGDPERGARLVLQDPDAGLVEDLPVQSRYYLSQLLALALAGRAGEAREALERWEAATPPEERTESARATFLLGKSVLQISEGDPEEAIRSLEDHRSLSGCAACHSWAMGWALRDAGRLQEAAEEWEWAATPRGAGTGIFMEFIPWTIQRLAPLYEELGDTERALALYQRLVEQWADADPELQPRVERARERIQALEGG
jgi:eukaryotic-like serine/threonine-protein kinase